MKNQPFPETGIYYTAAHEWIRFAGKFAFIGISQFRISAAKKINKIVWVKVYGCKPRGEVFASIQLDFQQLDLHMPVEGSIVQINDPDRLINEKLLQTDPEGEGWLIKISIRPGIEKNERCSKEHYAQQYLHAKPDHEHVIKSKPGSHQQPMVYGRRTI